MTHEVKLEAPSVRDTKKDYTGKWVLIYGPSTLHTCDVIDLDAQDFKIREECFEFKANQEIESFYLQRLVNKSRKKT